MKHGLLQGVAAACGLALALAGAVTVRGSDGAVGGDAVARVNGVPIPRSAVDRVRGQVGAGAGAAEAVLAAGLVDEELLVQRAVEIGLVDADRDVRKALVRAAIDETLRGVADRGPTEAALRAFHAEHAALFATPRRLCVRSISFGTREGADAAVRRAEAAAAAVAAGLSFAEADTRYGDRPGLPVPDDVLPEPVLRRVLGPTLTDAVRMLPPGTVSAPVRSGDAVHLLQVVKEEPARPASFEAARAAVEAEWRRRRGQDALDALLTRLRAQARIVHAADAPRP
jgi:hypothetical protein